MTDSEKEKRIKEINKQMADLEKEKSELQDEVLLTFKFLSPNKIKILSSLDASLWGYEATYESIVIGGGEPKHIGDPIKIIKIKNRKLK